MPFPLMKAFNYSLVYAAFLSAAESPVVVVDFERTPSKHSL